MSEFFSNSLPLRKNKTRSYETTYLKNGTMIIEYICHMEFEPSTNILTLGGSLSMKRQIVDKIILKRRALEEIAILQ